MDEFINLSIDDKKFVIEETALKYKLTPQIIEKDFWISYILKFLFNESKYKNYLTFKGGTIYIGVNNIGSSRYGYWEIIE